MKKNRIIQLSLLITATILFFFTYYFKGEDKIVDIEKKIPTESDGQLTEETSNILQNVNYFGTDNRGTFFELNAAEAIVTYDNPNISQLKGVLVVIKLSDSRIINIKSDEAKYDKNSNDCEFYGNVEVTEEDNVITSDNLNLYMSKNIITAFNNVRYNGVKGFLIADKVNIDMLTNEADIIMFNKNDKVKVKYKN
tara:strand:+ start:584 stop:1168 length:585 start_codon:yes stop_codon:yes gene_type:complete